VYGKSNELNMEFKTNLQSHLIQPKSVADSL